jgi:hypothetical protein
MIIVKKLNKLEWLQDKIERRIIKEVTRGVIIYKELIIVKQQ